MSPKVLFAVAGVLVLLLAWGVIVAAGRSLRAKRQGTTRGGGSSPVAGDGRDATVLGEVLKRRGLATDEQLAGMSPREVQMLFDTMTAKLPPAARTPASPSAETAVFSLNRPVQGRTAAIGRAFCPGCGTALDAGRDRPRFAAVCPGCGGQVTAQLLGVRLTLTVENGRGRQTPPPQA
jgi:hypothetical protein